MKPLLKRCYEMLDTLEPVNTKELRKLNKLLRDIQKELNTKTEK